MSRYDNTSTEKTEKGREYQAPTLYPKVPLSEDDLYVIATEGDRYDKLSIDFYGRVDYWWVIMAANSEVVAGDSLAIQPGTQIRIPENPEEYIRQYQEFNQK